MDNTWIAAIAAISAAIAAIAAIVTPFIVSARFQGKAESTLETLIKNSEKNDKRMDEIQKKLDDVTRFDARIAVLEEQVSSMKKVTDNLFPHLVKETMQNIMAVQQGDQKEITGGK